MDELLIAIDPVLIDYATTLHDRVAIAALTGILSHPTAYESICYQSAGDRTTPGNVALERAFEWADRFMRIRAERAK